MISLRRHIEAIRAADLEALRIARIEIDRRLAETNDLRKQMAEDRLKFEQRLGAERERYLDKSNYELRHQQLEQQLKTSTGALEGRLAQLELEAVGDRAVLAQRRSASARMIALASTIAALLSVMIALLIHFI